MDEACSGVTGGAELGECDHQRARGYAQRTETEMRVEAHRALIDGVDNDRADRELLRGKYNSPERVVQQDRAETAVLVAAIDSQRSSSSRPDSKPEVSWRAGSKRSVAAGGALTSLSAAQPDARRSAHRASGAHQGSGLPPRR